MNELDRTSAHRRVSRETRQLLTAALAALVVLWVLARVRFPDRPATPNPIPPLLTQLTARSAFADLAAEVTRARSRLTDTIVMVDQASAADGSKRDAPLTALRFRPNAVLTFLPPPFEEPPNLLVLDRATGLAVLRVETAAAGPAPASWQPDDLSSARFLLESMARDGGPAVRPVYIAGLQPLRSPAWSGPIWVVGRDAGLTPGSFLFSLPGEFAGAIVTDGDNVAIVPPDTLLADAQHLLERGRQVAGAIGIETQPLAGALAVAAGTSAGVIVAAVDPRGPAGPYVMVGDVIVAFDERSIDTQSAWTAAASRIGAGDTVVLHVLRGGTARRIEIVAVAAGTLHEPRGLGLTLRAIAGAGSEVLLVDPGSASAIAGIRPGDVITFIGGVQTPSPVRIRRAFAEVDRAKPLIVAVSREGRSRLMALVK
jgi:hypothetical protein